MDLFALYNRQTAATLDRWARDAGLPPDVDLGRFSVAALPVHAPGDLVVDAALVHARISASLGRDPLDLARLVARALSAEPSCASVEVAGPGFVNVTLTFATILEAVASVLRAGGNVVPSPADLRPGLSPGEARAIVAAEQLLALRAAAGCPPPCGDTGGTVPGPVVVRGRWAAGGGMPAGLSGEAFRFAVASRRPDAPLHVDPTALADRSRANPAFWVLYAHARFRAVLRRAAAALPDLDLAPAALAEADLSGLSDPGEAALARVIARHAPVVCTSAARGSPQQLAAHLGDLATAVHSQWNRSKGQPQLRFVNEEERDLTKARLGLVTASTLVLKSGLGILGLGAPDEMR